MVYSPPPPRCGTGYPSASAASPCPTAAILCSASSRIPSPHPCGCVVFQLCVRAREEGEPAAPPPPLPLWNRMVFPFAMYGTHTHTPRLCECMAILSPNHTHTDHVSVYVWHSLSVHALLLSLRSILSPPFPPPWYISCHILLYLNK